MDKKQFEILMELLELETIEILGDARFATDIMQLEWQSPFLEEVDHF